MAMERGGEGVSDSLCDLRLRNGLELCLLRLEVAHDTSLIG